MSIISGANAVTGAGAVSYQIENSLRFNSADSAYLSWTPASAGSLTTWTWSGWFKRSALGARQTFFSGGPGGSDTAFTQIVIWDDDKLRVGGWATNWRITTQVFRDVSAWMHLVVVWDTGNGTAADKVRVYLNGSRVTAFDTSNSPTNSGINQAAAHAIGRDNSDSTKYFSGYLTEVNFIDGSALDPTSFGEYNSVTGVWQPKAYTGSYGTNGFYLPMQVGSSGWSGQFDGSGDYLSLPANSGFHFGSSDFTIEQWINIPTSNQKIAWHDNSVSFGSRTITGSVILTTNTWHHVACTKQGTTLRLYVDGVLDTSGTILSEVYNNNDPLFIGKGADHTTGSGRDMLHCGELGGGNNKWFFYTTGNGTGDFQGYMSNLRILKGTALYTGSTYTVPTSPLTAITNTQVLTLQNSTFIDNSPNALTVTVTGNTKTQNFAPFNLVDVIDDYSGNGNNWQPNNLNLSTSGSGADIMVDTPTPYGTDTGAGGEVRGNYATLNPLDKNGGSTVDGNLNFTNGAATSYMAGSTIVPTMPIYAEFQPTGWGNGNIEVGLRTSVGATNSFVSDSGGVSYNFRYGTVIYNGSTQGTYTAATGTSSVVMMAYDPSSGKLWFGLNGTWFNSGNPAAGTGQVYTITTPTSAWRVFVQAWDTTNAVCANFGQRPSAYTAPSGFKALCTQNLPEPTVVDGGNYFNAVLYTGNGGTQTVSGVGFQPNLTWIKQRGGATNNWLNDSVRGAGYSLSSNTTAAEDNYTAYFTAFNSDGFALAGGTNGFNTNAGTYVAWNWKAGGTGVSNTDGTNTSAVVSANPTAGFSIVTYTGTGANATVGHGLGAAPAFFVIKQRSNIENWIVYHQNQNASPASGHLMLQSTAAFTSSSTVFNNTAPTSSVFSVGTAGGTNESGQTFVAYCFAPVEGYSAFGSYTGNGSSDGPFVYTGFRPAYVLIKASSIAGENWYVVDATRSPYNAAILYLSPNSSGAESSPGAAQFFDFLSNGFKLRVSGSYSNSSGATYIYAAFAENPFKYALAR